MSPNDKVWITGAGSGIGQALALRLAARGHSVIATGRRAGPLQALHDHDASITAMPLDVTDGIAIEQALAAIPCPDIAVLCAGTHSPTPGQAFDAGRVRQLVETNLLGTVNCLGSLLPRMLARGTGHIVIVASVAGYRGLPTAGGYCASKAGLIALAESLRLDLSGTAVHVQLVSPGFVDTPLTRANPFPMPDIITADAAARAIEQGMARPERFEIAFPWRFALVMRTLRLLPDAWYFPLMHKVTGL